MSSGQLTTSISPFGGIGTSFSKDRDYFVSTVESPSNSSRFETLIKFIGGDVVPICIIVAMNSKDAVSNHIAMARMGISTNRSDWNEVVVKEFEPIQLIEMLVSNETSYQPESLRCEYCETLLSMSGLNYKKKSGPSVFHMAAYLAALAVGGKYGWLYGYDISGMVLAIVFAIVGAVLAATLVGVVASKFGYRP